MIMVLLVDLLIIWVSFCFMRFSSMIVVFLFLSLPRVRFWVVASWVRLMWSAFSFVVRACEVVVFPVHGVPVMSMTCLVMFVLALLCWNGFLAPLYIGSAWVLACF